MNEESTQLKKTRKPRTPKPVAPTITTMPSEVRIKSLALGGSGTDVTVETTGESPTTLVFTGMPNDGTLRLGDIYRVSLSPKADASQR